ncbi:MULTISPECIES: ABC transporter substrate-binding protein [Pusillimonas]|uniref:ABC transporter substrate-binding protein n=1 Tax=Pusillimonas TaxID=305976 RepID=UPI000E59BBBE|nr:MULTISPECIES: extracellular solute-binding protein [Pusillimonas]MDX3894509.1 extracellular solute-binding protein [Pusillimonas sp.]TFL09413.1 extracellular solute-binding protein [Pusillimonas caeni]
MNTLSFFLRGLLLALGISCAAGAAAQSPLQYQGPDRGQRLQEGAREEGKLMLYTSMAEKDVQDLVGAFEKRYGIKVEVWRSGKNKVLQRALAEAGAGRNVVDVVQNPAPEMEALHREKLLQPVSSPLHAQLIEQALPEHGEWAGMRTYVFVQAFNPQRVSRDELPASYEDLLDPRWKGRLGIEAKNQEWFMTLMQQMGEKKGLDYFQRLVATNGVSLRTGHSLLANMVVAGEVPLAITMYSYLVEQKKAEGAPIDYVALAPTIAYTDGIGIARKAPHPHAAMLFYEFMLSEGQQMVARDHQITTHRRDLPKLDAFSPVYIDPAKVLDTYDEWRKRYDDVLNGRPIADAPSK